ncbi:hypothetical protein T484DRAFT_2661352 [Baffinella frigidus]|nr:hypothetical protein T484DRAFT_2661352 [Cryptophyta sp. CCMP2293]
MFDKELGPAPHRESSVRERELSLACKDTPRPRLHTQVHETRQGIFERCGCAAHQWQPTNCLQTRFLPFPPLGQKQHHQPQLTTPYPRLRPTCRPHPERPTPQCPAGRGCAGQNPPSRAAGSCWQAGPRIFQRFEKGAPQGVPIMQDPPGHQLYTGRVYTSGNPPLHRRPLQGQMACTTIQRRWDEDSRG